MIMVYINETSGTINIPRHTFDSTGAFTLKVSNISGTITLVDSGNDISTNTMYYKFALGSLASLNVGEYTYELFDGSHNMIETGLLTYGEYTRTVIVNNTFNNEKKQYNG